ncbi:nitroreductase family deazaflavin-dependent oxidoreductase [Phototrophicus methaneseepsis]|uniref:Nitroreductase family deazaflavin-dependent oxidoreductase n=1 Tax=Phototrophicus methaneseepsis TaxID=2710758 RepID=A0A7S8E7K3_9CHLR|nr:nitroreductase family deazaflavin-dependent oxidoreductase [Phototrophicus methaneseepsis]QPC81821.1 nitroreductase family deazaflavin-dependent oxidoreductase [Phototrophicus methaneseepsis]
MSDWNKAIIEEFRANEGRVGGPFQGANLLLLHTKGAKSGLERVNPMMYFMDDDRYVVVASKAGAETNPDWYHNLVANPEVSVEAGTEQFDAVASVTSEPERTQLYKKMESISSGFTEYKNKTSRVIPVITLTRKS